MTKEELYRIKQDELFANYLDAIKPERDTYDARLLELSTKYEQAIKPFKDAYIESIQLEYKWAENKINPALKKLDVKLQEIKQEAFRKTNLLIEQHSKWQEGVQKKFDEKTKDRKEKFDLATEQDRQEYEAEVAVIQKTFDEMIKPSHEQYLELAKKIEDEYGVLHTLSATPPTQNDVVN